jgi:hypothetical protein
VNEIVFPAIQDKTDKTMAQYRKQFHKNNLIIKDKFPVGSLVMAKNELRNSKAEERFTGPFKVKNRTVNGTYNLIDAIGTEFTRAPSALKLIRSNLDAAEIHKVVDERKDNAGEWEYLVKWKNTFAPEEWLPVKNFHDLQPVREFLDHRAKKQQRA